MSRYRTISQTGRLRMAANATVLCSVIAISGCSMFQDLDWFTDEVAPLPGERIAVLANERSLQADIAPEELNILLPAPTPSPDWPMSGGYANHAMHHIEVRDQLAEEWSVDIGSGADDELRFIGAPIVANGRAYAMDTDTEVSSYELASGDRLWTADLEPDEDDDGHIGGGLAFEGGRVFVATGFGAIIALNADNGERVWERNIGVPFRVAPTVRDGRLFVVTVDNRLFALNAENGDQLWTHAGAQEIASLLGGASPAVDGDTVVVPYSSGELFALEAEDGRVLWQQSLVSVRRTDAVAALAQIRGNPVIDRGLVIAISHGGVMAAINLRSGRRVWSRDIGGQASPWVAGDYIFTITNDSELIAVSRDEGQVLWVSGLPRFEDEEDREDPIYWSGPILVSDRLVVVGSNGEAFALSPYNGRVLGLVELPDGASVAPISASGYVLFLANDAELVAYR